MLSESKRRRNSRSLARVRGVDVYPGLPPRREVGCHAPVLGRFVLVRSLKLCGGDFEGRARNSRIKALVRSKDRVMSLAAGAGKFWIGDAHECLSKTKKLVLLSDEQPTEERELDIVVLKRPV